MASLALGAGLAAGAVRDAILDRLGAIGKHAPGGSKRIAAAHPLGLMVGAAADLSGGLAALLLAGYAAALALHVAAARLAGLPLWLALLLPAYWLALWAALLLALRDLARDPAHWRKTEHGAVDRGGAASPSEASRGEPMAQ